MSVEFPGFTSSCTNDSDEAMQPDDIYDADTETLQGYLHSSSDFGEDLCMLIERELREREEAERLRNQILQRLSGLSTDNNKVVTVSPTEPLGGYKVSNTVDREGEQSTSEIVRFELTSVQHCKPSARKSLDKWEPQRVTDMPFVVGNPNGTKKKKVKRDRKPNMGKNVPPDKAKESPAKQKLRKMKEYSTMLKTRSNCKCRAGSKSGSRASADVQMRSDSDTSNRVDLEIDGERNCEGGEEDVQVESEKYVNNITSEIDRVNVEHQTTFGAPSAEFSDGYTNDEFDESSTSETSIDSENGNIPGTRPGNNIEAPGPTNTDEEEVIQLVGICDHESCEEPPEIPSMRTVNNDDEHSDEPVEGKSDVDENSREHSRVYDGVAHDDIGGVLDVRESPDPYPQTSYMFDCEGSNKATYSSGVVEDEGDEKLKENVKEESTGGVDAVAAPEGMVAHDAGSEPIEKDIDRRQHPTKAYKKAFEIYCFADFRNTLLGVSMGEPALVKNDPDTQIYYKVVQSRVEVYDVVSRSLANNPKYSELPHGCRIGPVWNLLWTWGRPKLDYSKLLVWQKVNHFPDSKFLSRKDCLKRCIDRYVKRPPGSRGSQLAEFFRVTPETFVLPHDYCDFIEMFSKYREKSPSETMWIMKPVCSSRGRGISVISDINEVSYSEPTIVQKYIERPLLLDGYKFDLRIYVLVTSFNPLEAYIYKEGFARLATVKYSITAHDMKNRLIHLTNTSVQKKHVDSLPNDKHRMLGGTKLSFEDLSYRLDNKGIAWSALWREVKHIVVKTLVMCEHAIDYQVNSFELYGFDVMFDDSLRGWLLEVNSSPSMNLDTLLDERIKVSLIRDVIGVINPLPFNRRAILEVLSRRVGSSSPEAAYSTKPSRLPNKKVSTRQLNVDLHAILCGELPNEVQKDPLLIETAYNFERIAPGEPWESTIISKNKIFIPSHGPI